MDSRSCWVLWCRAGQVSWLNPMIQTQWGVSHGTRGWAILKLDGNWHHLEVLVFQQSKLYGDCFAARSGRQRDILCKAGGVLSGYFPCLLPPIFCFWIDKFGVLGTQSWWTSSCYVSCTGCPHRFDNMSSPPHSSPRTLKKHQNLPPTFNYQFHCPIWYLSNNAVTFKATLLAWFCVWSTRTLGTAVAGTVLSG